MRRPTSRGKYGTPTSFVTRKGHRKAPKAKTRKESLSTGRNHPASTIRRMGNLMGRKVR